LRSWRFIPENSPSLKEKEVIQGILDMKNINTNNKGIKGTP
jgi:hypothetical protein